MSNALACRKQGKQALVAATIIQKSNMSKHTPGPWKVNEHSEVTFKDGRICDVDYYNVGRGEKGRYQLPHEANARLIAAAPELLEFVEDVAEGLDTGGNPGHLEDAVENLEERAQCIIARIKGDE